MKDTVYLILNSRRVLRMSKEKPSTKSGEVAVALRISVNDDYFAKIIPQVNVTLDGNSLVAPVLEVKSELAEPQLSVESAVQETQND